MPILKTELEVCDFCYSSFKEYAPKHQFNYGKKEKFTTCSCCGQRMCYDCHKHSLEELKGSILAQYGFSICRNCVVSFRRTTSFQEKLENEVIKAIETVKKTMHQHVYTLTEKR